MAAKVTRADASLPRQATVSMRYRRAKKGSREQVFAFNKYISSLTYTEVADGECDTVSITVSLKDVVWTCKDTKSMKRWFPEKGDRMRVAIVTTNWRAAGKKERFDCGRFCLDDVTISGPTVTLVLAGTSVPELGAIRSVKRTRTWKGATIREIAGVMKERYKLDIPLDFSGGEVYAVSEKQEKEDDLSFLTRICKDMGLGIRINSGTLRIYSKKRYEKRGPKVRLLRSSMTDWSYNDTLVDTYTCAEIRCAETSEHTALICRVGSGKRKLVIDETFEDRTEGAVKACARLNEKNEKAVTLSVTIPADLRIHAARTVRVQGLGKMSGTYFVDKVTHELDSDQGYTMDLELHRCRKRLDPAENVVFIGGPKTAETGDGKSMDDTVVTTTGDFVHDIAAYLQKYAPARGIEAISAVIAQIINESGWGKSRLAAEYHNYNGMKCGTGWTGKRVSMPTQEWIGGGYVTITADFRAYDSMEEGIKGYLDLLDQPRYANLKGVTDPRRFLELIRADGYATSPTYVDDIYQLIAENDLTQYDPGGRNGQLNTVGAGSQARQVVERAASYLGQGGAIFQAETGLGQGQPWCASFVCSIFRWCGLAGIYYSGPNPNWCANILDWGRQAGYEVPKESAQRGDIILFTWSGGAGIDHIGIIEANNGGSYTTIEGNYSNTVARVNRLVNGTVVAIIRPPYTS